jgi:integrative and conjugative element protein (TIGR02256 family)
MVKVRVDFPKPEISRMSSLLKRAGKREIGGVLMAEQISEGHFRIVDFSVDDATGSVAHFVRSPEHHQLSLSSFFDRTGSDYTRFNYLGEWHSHPSYPVIPSSQDIASMQDLVEGERGINFATLMIVRRKSFWRFECTTLLFQRGLMPQGVELNICEIGDNEF